jgi:hypothetical protein
MLCVDCHVARETARQGVSVIVAKLLLFLLPLLDDGDQAQ